MEKYLLKGEKVLATLKPHPLAMTPFYIYFIYYIVVNLLILLNWDKFVAAIEGSFIGVLGKSFVFGAIALFWWIITLLPAIIIAVLRISWKWLIFFFLVALASSILLFYGYISVENLFHITAGIAFVGILLTDVYRRSHEYIITNYRIVTKLGFFGEKIRDVFYNKITDVVVEQGVLGKIFNFGNVIPMTASGIGTGVDEAHVTVAGGGAGKAAGGTVGGGVAITGTRGVTVPRGRSSYILYGVPNPDDVRKVVLENMKEAIASYKLDRIVDLLEDVVEEKKGKGDK